MSLVGDSGNCMTVVDQVSWCQSMQAFVYCHDELVLNPLANWQPVKVAEHRSDVVEFRAPVTNQHHCSVFTPTFLILYHALFVTGFNKDIDEAKN